MPLLGMMWVQFYQGQPSVISAYLCWQLLATCLRMKPICSDPAIGPFSLLASALSSRHLRAVLPLAFSSPGRPARFRLGQPDLEPANLHGHRAPVLPLSFASPPRAWFGLGPSDAFLLFQRSPHRSTFAALSIRRSSCRCQKQLVVPSQQPWGSSYLSKRGRTAGRTSLRDSGPTLHPSSACRQSEHQLRLPFMSKIEMLPQKLNSRYFHGLHSY